MMSLREYRGHAAQLADFLPWVALVAPGVMLNKDGSFQRTARFRGPDLDSSTPAELVAVTARLNNALRRLGSGWAVFVEAQRLPALDYPESSFPDELSALVDLERREQFREDGAHFESRYYLTLLWFPPAEDVARAESWLYEGRARNGVDASELLRNFIDRTDRLLHLVEGFMPESAWLDDGETLTYLHSTISTRRQRVRVPEVPAYLDAILPDEPLTGGLEPRLGEHHLRTLTITGLPSTTFPGLLDDLNALPFSYRWSTRAIMLDKTDATKLLSKIRRQWFAKRKSVAAILKEVMTNEASALTDSDATNKAADADLALQELGADAAGIAYVTATVTVCDKDPARATEKLRQVEKVIQGRDFTCMAEGLNAIEAWLGSLPGQVYANVRQPPVSTLNLAHMIPLSAVWAGAERDEHFGQPPLFHARTEGSTPFRFSLHVGDVGHTLVVGPTGAGKSVLLGLMALQFRRYSENQIFAFDFGGSIRAATLGMGGDWENLGDALGNTLDLGVALQPLARIDETVERAWAADWITAILAGEGVALDPAGKEQLWTALTSLASAPIAMLNQNARARRAAYEELGHDVAIRTERGIRHFADNDRILFLRNERELGVKNGTLGTIEKAARDKLAVRLDDGRRIRVDLKSYAHVDHGYAATVHKTQGMTVDCTHVLATPGLDAHSSYVALSRHRHGTALHYGRDDFADERTLRRTLTRERPKDMALDYRGDASPPQTIDQEVSGMDPRPTNGRDGCQARTPTDRAAALRAMVAARVKAPKPTAESMREALAKAATAVTSRGQSRGRDYGAER